MTSWQNAKDVTPPVSLSVLIYAVYFHGDLESMWNDQILIGFWSNETDDDYKGWYLDTVDGYEKFDQTNYNIIAWTLIPEKPFISFKNDHRKKTNER